MNGSSTNCCAKDRLDEEDQPGLCEEGKTMIAHDTELEEWICAELWTNREISEAFDMNLEVERLRLIDLKYAIACHRGAWTLDSLGDDSQ